MLTLEIPNFKETNVLEKAKVAADVLKGATSFTIDNPQNIAVNNYVLLGKVGGGVSKIHKVQSVTGSTVALTASIDFNLERGTAVTRLLGNQIKIYTAPYNVSTVPVTANFSVLSGTPFDIDPDQSYTLYTDASGSDQTWYRYTYYNSDTSFESSLDDAPSVRDTTQTDYTTLEAIRREAGFMNDDYVTDDNIARKRNAAQQRINGMLAGRYVIPFPQPIDGWISDLTTRLAAGNLMVERFGAFDGTSKTTGAQMRDDAIKELEQIQSGSAIITNAQGQTTVTDDGSGFKSSFNSDTEALFSLQDRY